MEKQSCEINNAFYDDLGEMWYTSSDHPIALLRKENEIRSLWVQQQICRHTKKPVNILDIGCGGGFLSNYLAEQGHRVTGIDLSNQSLEVAKKHDRTNTVCYLHANAYQLPFPDGSFDAVCAMDILEHIEEPQKLIQEASRLLSKDGLFFFHTFNRTWLSFLFAVRGLELAVKNAPKHIHLYRLFIKPKELVELCSQQKLLILDIIGLMPDMKKPAFWKMLMTRKVPDDFAFRFTKSLSVGYCGYAKKLCT